MILHVILEVVGAKSRDTRPGFRPRICAKAAKVASRKEKSSMRNANIIKTVIFGRYYHKNVHGPKNSLYCKNFQMVHQIE